VLTERQPRIRIAHLPTPIEPLPRLSSRLGGPNLWVKRDDLTGLAGGGNKARKLEFFVAEALATGADTLVTCGAVQSNHARQTAAAAAKLGLGCTLVLRSREPLESQGNLLLDRLLGAQIVWAEDRPADERLVEVAEELRASGRRPYLVPYGGSTPVGACGYVAAMEELLDQATREGISFDRIVFPSSSGGTQAGLAVAARALSYKGEVLGISVDLTARDLQEKLAPLATATAELLELPASFAPEDFLVEDAYTGAGYAVLGDLEREAIRTAAETEGLLLDPVYTGRAFGGLLDLIRQGAFDPGERLLFWHTGGIPALFAYSEALAI